MCIAYPGLVLSVEDGAALVEIDRRRQRASLVLTPDVRAGDWVVVSAGTVVERLAPEEAEEIRRLLDEAAQV
ncbi:MAG TPA: HypC/HybG/HupF family hydrogenase formation chaperone [Candidatus Limnocylindria bacterium]|nr:HypC/HybG/HupF family hydrogenase formation chaperone [Candidatus Limnocylindria bacterium]